MPISRLTSLALLAAVLLLTMGGCYTIMTHPGAEETDSDIEQSADCVSCHSDYHEYPYGYYYGYYPDYWWSSPRWGHYYAYPWWWDYYWPEGEYDEDNEDQLVPRSSRGEKAVRRESLRPPYSSGVSSITREGSLTPSSSPDQTPASGTKNPSETPGKPKTEQKKDDDSDRKTPRRSGDRRQ